MSPDLKKVAVDLFKNKEKISDIAWVLQQPRSIKSDIIRRFREAGTVENCLRLGRPAAMDDRDYRHSEKIVKTERRALLVEITAKFNEERNGSVSKWTVRRRLRDRGFSRRVCRKKVVIKFDNRNKQLRQERMIHPSSTFIQYL
jgi:transposase